MKKLLLLFVLLAGFTVGSFGQEKEPKGYILQIKKNGYIVGEHKVTETTTIRYTTTGFLHVSSPSESKQYDPREFDIVSFKETEDVKTTSDKKGTAKSISP